MPKNDKTFLQLHKYILTKNYSNEWKEQPDNKYAESLMNVASKNLTGKGGYVDLCYINDSEKILILLELKPKISLHSKAIADIKHYLSFFNKDLYPKEPQFKYTDSDIQMALTYFKDWKILGIAVSGDVLTELKYKIDTFVIDMSESTSQIRDMSINSIKNEKDYIYLFKNIDKESLISTISESSSWINNCLYDVKEDKRPTLLSILLISLYPSKKVNNDFIDKFIGYDSGEMLSQIEITIKKILGVKGENIRAEKIEMILAELATFKSEKSLTETNVIRTILEELKNHIIPLFDIDSSYDIVGKFYQEFLRYAGMVDVQSGIVLTPEHVAELFTDLVKIKKDDIFFDSCCGTGSLLIGGMNKLLKLQSTDEEKEHVRSCQIIGNELKAHMYILAISNMLFRGDGKSNILNCDFFSEDFDSQFSDVIEECGNPTIGFINPPYSGSFTDYTELVKFKEQSSKKNKNKNRKPWMKEISFLKKMCEICTRYVVMIAPPQVFMGEKAIRNEILDKHTLKAVITMPKDLFQPSASTGSAIIVIETHKKHNYKKPVIFYNLSEDGFELAKKKGRRDIYYKWNDIHYNLLKNINAPGFEYIDLEKSKTSVYNYSNPQNVDGITNCSVIISKDDEWLVQAFSKVVWENLKDKHFEKTIKEYSIFLAKKELGVLFKKLDDAELLSVFETVTKDSICSKKPSHKNFKEVPISYVFDKPYGCKQKIAEKDLKEGEYLYITTSNKNNGVSGCHSEYCEEGDTFTIDSATDGKCFYQADPFIGSDHVEILPVLEKYKEKINIFTALYLITLLNFYLDKYEYSRKRAQVRIKKETIQLPFTENGEIDWSYMECLIKSIPYSKNLE